QQVLAGVPQQISYPRTDETELLLQIDDQNQVREALEQVSLELFLAPEGPLHLSPLGDVDQRALVANDRAGCVPDRTRSVQDRDQGSIFAPQRNLPCADATLIVGRASQHRTLLRVPVQRGWIKG